MTKKKRHYVKILFPDNKKYVFNIYDSYEEKIETINKVLERWYDYIIDNWDKTLIINGTPQRPVVNMLNMLTYYLLFESKAVLNENSILNIPKEKEIHKKEIPLYCCDTDVQDLFYSASVDSIDYSKSNKILQDFVKVNNFDKRYKRFNHLKNIDKEFINHIKIITGTKFNSLSKKTKLIKLMKLDENLFLFIREKYYEPEFDKYKIDVCKNLMWHYSKIKSNYKISDKTIKDKNYIMNLAKKSYMDILTSFEKIELVKKYVLKSKPYEFEWAIIWEDNTFEFNNESYKVIDSYKFDRIYCYKQGNKIWFYDLNINLINKIIKE